MKAEVSAVSRLRIGIDGEGVTTLVAFMLCPLECRFCLNPQTLSLDYPYEEFTPESLYEELKKDELYFLATGGGVTFGGGEPLLRHGFIREFRKVCGPGWRINLETSLNVPKVFLEDVIPVTDSFIIDIKDMDPRIYSNYTGRDNKLVIDNLRMLSVNGLAPKCIIRIPEIPGFNDQDALLESERKVRSLGFENIDRFKYDTEYGKRKRNMQDA
jgi:Pyruvate-formate lyase-activating enzyme